MGGMFLKAMNRMGFHRLGKLNWILGFLWLILAMSADYLPVAFAQEKAPKGGQSTKGQSRKMTEQERRAERAREMFADAANAQNNGAYDLAIEQWNKMIADFPDNPLASSARHFLGVCYQEKDPPEYSKAIEAFRSALKDPNLKEREEALIQLGWSLFQTAVAQEPANTDMLTECSKVFASFLDKYSDSPLADKAMFYAGEAESRLGKSDRAIAFYNQLLQNRNFAQSSLRPDAMFSLGLSYEEASQRKLAMETYEGFIAAYPKHILATNTKVRLAELALQSEQIDKAVKLFASIVDSPDLQKMAIADYVMYRYAFALAKAGQFANSSNVYKKLAEQFPKSQYAANASLAIGQTLMRDKKYDEASRALERLLGAKDERAVEASHWLCQIAMLKNQPADAIPIAREALQWATKWDPKTISPSTASMVTWLRMDLADGLYATTDGKSEARKLYEQIAVEAPDSPICPRATYNAAFAALQAGDHAEAQRWSEAFAKRFPNDELALDVAYVRAESLLQLSQFESSATAFEQLVRSANNHPSLIAWELRAATAKYLAGNFDGAVNAAATLQSRSLEPAARAEALYLKGASLLKLNKTQESIQAFEESLQANATWTQADETLLLLSQAYDALQDKTKSKNALERLLKEFPKSRFRQQAEFRLGQLSAAANDFPAALIWYDRVLSQSIDPSLADFVRYDKAFVLIQTERFPEALEILNQVSGSTKNPSLLAECAIAKAICSRRTNRAAEAIATLEKMLTPELPASAKPKVLYELGLAYSEQKDFDKTIQVMTELVEKYPNYTLIERAYFELAWAYKSKGDVANAKQWFQRIAEQFPNSPLAAESYFHVGQTEFENARFDSAVKAYTVAATKTASPEILEKSLYKLGLSLFQQQDYTSASQQFSKQLKTFPNGSLSMDARLMIAECSFKLEQFSTAWPQYEQARKALENHPDAPSINDQVKALIYLHGAQTARELKRWNDVDDWTGRLQEVLPESNFKTVAIYEQAFARQNLKRVDEAIRLFEQVAESERNALGARARFMIGEAYFADRNFAKAITEFQKTMYGFGGTQAAEDAKNWQARSAFEAGRCSEIFIADLKGERRKKAIDTAVKFYEYILENHPKHEMSEQAQQRIAELKK